MSVTTDAAVEVRSPAATPQRHRLSPRDRLNQTALYVLLAALALIYIYPFLVQVATSFKTEQEAASDPISLIPQTFTFAAYERLFLHSDFPLWFANSAIVTICVTLGRVFFVSLAGYALARLRFRGRSVVFALVVGVMAVPAVVLLIPKFLVLRQLGLYDSYAGMILPLLVDAAGVFIMKNFFESIPASVEEQARIDGAGTFRVFWSVVLPMARPALITIVILSFQGSWNELSHFIVSTQSPGLTTLTKGVASLASGQLSQGTQYPLKLAAAAIMTIPVAVLFFIFQRRIMNTSEGAVKG
ncbi:MAG: ABC transporter permease [Microbacterium sp. SCN 70-200]|uniref:carbohydrate ABC transporter permease n=1 Tax=unclassified Microbacterium TaxID=2609290 RepID=UPI00086B24B9|nr:MULTISPECIES: carbohydrate ABC transporter permease [unclassified Microbacterium]MBN9213474.1 carbohydrate ABC transporter permease [Microbacterium sp.]ODT41702.1 MAG: ABC transporter permease [Microbacterium sp. SCN 70-200]OJV85106.1 MAG: ABC transporter permease [Microbacterium sp. 70-16]